MPINASYYGNKKPTSGEKPLRREIVSIDQMEAPLPFGKKNPVDAMTGKHLFRLDKPSEVVADSVQGALIVYLRANATYVPEIGRPYALGTIEGTASGKMLVSGATFSIVALEDDSPFAVSIETGMYKNTGSVGYGDASRAIVCGMVPALVTIADSSHKFASIVAGVLTSSVTGYARIIWKNGTSGEQWCLLDIPTESISEIIVPPGPNMVLGSDGSSNLLWYKTHLVEGY